MTNQTDSAPASRPPLDLPVDLPQVDAVVIGGGPAGLSAAIALGRARRSVVVIDAGEPRNAPADGVHNFLTRDGTPPLEMLALGRAEAAVYDVEIVDGRVVGLLRDGSGFVIEATRPGGGTRSFRARRVVLATGVEDVLPPIPGLRARWGHDAIHCPYCHGWEVRDQAIGVIGGGAASVHLALLFRQWSDRITYFVNTGFGGALALTDDQAEQFAARGIAVVDGLVDEIVAEGEGEGGGLIGARVGDTVHPLDAVVPPGRVAVRTVPGLDAAGVRIAEHPSGMGTFIVAEDGVAAPGIWVAGNATDLRAQVITSAGDGLWVGASVNMDLVAEETAAAVATYRAR